jgi:long-chain acyl-CoA synthetase
MNIAASLARSAADNPDRVAIRLGDQTTSYRELDDQSARVAGLLAARGIAPGTAIGIMLPNVPEFASVYYGVLRAGGVVVPMNPLLKAREVAYYLGDSGAPVIFAWHVAAPEVEIGAKEGRDRDSGAAGRRPRGRRHGGHPLHVGHDGAAQGCGTYPLKSDQ